MTMSAATFTNITLIGSTGENHVAATLQELASHLLARGATVMAEQDVNVPLPAKVVLKPTSGLTAQSDLVITVGGDGTMLRAARIFAESGVPLVGINRGRLGFLADINPKDIIARIDEVLDGKYKHGSRSLLQVRLITADGNINQALVVNDCVLQKWETGRMLDYETWIDGQYVNTHGGDGVIVASATGSTAYALSCGGPIIHPHLDALVIAPICPHTLSDRPIVISSRSTVEIRRVQDRATKAQITCDGEILGDLNVGDRLLIEPSQLRVNFLHPTDHDYYRILRSKLHWGRGALDKRIEDDVD
jgi:NAD+ kinase